MERNFKPDCNDFYANIRINLANKTFNFVSERNMIKSDNGMWEGYKANIAMQFKDHVHYYKKFHNKKYLNSEDIHKIANDAADCFLHLWCS